MPWADCGVVRGAAASIEQWLNGGSTDPSSLSSPNVLLKLFADRPAAKLCLVDFFAYSCTNCLRTIPGLIDLHSAFGPAGLLVVGFHRPEFDFEREVPPPKTHSPPQCRRRPPRWPLPLCCCLAAECGGDRPAVVCDTWQEANLRRFCLAKGIEYLVGLD